MSDTNPLGKVEVEFNVEIVCKTDGDWLWAVFDANGELRDCGHEASLQATRDNILLTLEGELDKRLHTEWPRTRIKVQR